MADEPVPYVVRCPTCGGTWLTKIVEIEAVRGVRVQEGVEWPSVRQRVRYVCAACGGGVPPRIELREERYTP